MSNGPRGLYVFRWCQSASDVSLGPDGHPWAGKRVRGTRTKVKILCTRVQWVVEIGFLSRAWVTGSLSVDGEASLRGAGQTSRISIFFVGPWQGSFYVMCKHVHSSFEICVYRWLGSYACITFFKRSKNAFNDFKGFKNFYPSYLLYYYFEMEV